MQNNLAIVTRAIDYLSENVHLPREHDGLSIIYRVSVEDRAVLVQGFFPMSDGVAVNAKEEQMDGRLWIGARSVVQSDYILADGDANDLVRLYQLFRENRYENFSFDPARAVVTLKLENEIAESLFN